jgi:hypothetical protein
MATIGNSYLDLIDLFKRSGSDDKLQAATIIELLSQTNAVLDDAMAVEANLGTRHRTTVRTGLPSVTWGQLYKGIPQSKSATTQVEDTTGMLEALSTVDSRLLELSGNEGAMRLSEARSFLESMSQTAASTLFYGDVTANPDRFTGLAPRFNSLGAPNGGQIVDAGGTGSSNTSVWFVTWGENTCHMIYPQGTNAGISRQDKGEQRVTDADGNAFYVKEELFRWHLGVSVRDWRQVVRIANIDITNLRAGTVDIYKFMRAAFWKLKSHRVSGGKICIYANADVLEALDAHSTPTMSSNVPSNSTGSLVRLRPSEVDGKEVMAYRGFPVRQVDALLNNEARVV